MVCWCVGVKWLRVLWGLEVWLERIRGVGFALCFEALRLRFGWGGGWEVGGGVWCGG